MYFTGDSAELGYAIALLLNASNSPIKNAIATGALSKDTRKNQHVDYDTAIKSVGSIQQKLQLVIEKHQAKELSAESLYFFTPYFYRKEESDKDYLVEELNEVKELAALNIIVKPIKWLSDVAKILHAEKTQYLAEDKALISSAGSVSTLVLSAFLYSSWWHYPIPIEILKGKQKPEPFLVCANRDHTSIEYFDLKRDGTTPLLLVFAKENSDYNMGIAWKLKPLLTPFTNRYYVALIDLGEKSGYKIINRHFDTNKPIIAIADEVLKWYWPMEEGKGKSYQENKALMISLQRTPINRDELYRQLNERFSSTKKLNLSEVKAFILAKFPSSYSFSYKSIFAESPCIKSSVS